IDLRTVRVADRGQHAPVDLPLPPRRVDGAAGRQTILDALDCSGHHAIHGATAGHRLPQVLREAVLVAVALADPDDEPLVVLLPFLAVAAARLELRRELGTASHELVAPDVAIALADGEANVRVE